jgi:hypothetical protein
VSYSAFAVAGIAGIAGIGGSVAVAGGALLAAASGMDAGCDLRNSSYEKATDLQLSNTNTNERSFN